MSVNVVVGEGIPVVVGEGVAEGEGVLVIVGEGVAVRIGALVTVAVDVEEANAFKRSLAIAIQSEGISPRGKLRSACQSVLAARMLPACSRAWAR